MALRREVAHNRNEEDAAEEFLQGILQHQERILQHQEKELERIRGEQEKADRALAKAKKELAKQEGELAKQEGELAKQEGELAKQEGELTKAEANLEKEQEILNNKKTFGRVGQESQLRYKEASVLLSQFRGKIKDRTVLAASIIKEIVACDETKEDQAFKAGVAQLESRLPDVEKIIQEENEIQKQLLSKMDEVEETINQMKAVLDQLPADRTPYAAQVHSYDTSVTCFSGQCEKFETMRPHKKNADEFCTLLKYNISELQRKLKDQQNSPPSSGGHTPPSDSELSASASADEMQAGKFSSSSPDSSPAGSPPKKASASMFHALQPPAAASVRDVAATKAAAAPASKKGLFGNLFGSDSKNKKPTPPALPSKSANNGQALVFK